MKRTYRALVFWILCLGCSSVTAKCAGGLTFNAAERAWLDQHPVVRFSIDPYWKPVEYSDRNGAHGLTVAYLQCVAHKAGIRLEFVPSNSWQESVDNLLAGKVDLLPGLPDFLLPARAQGRLAVSQPYFVGATIAIANATNRNYFDLDNLAPGDVVALKEGGAYEAWMRQRYPQVRLLLVSTDEKALNAVARGSANVAIGLEPVVHPMIHQRYGGVLFIAGTLSKLPVVLRMGTLSSNPELARIIDRGLGAIDAEEAESIYQVWVEEADYGRPAFAALIKYYGSRMALMLVVLALLVIALYQSLSARPAAMEVPRQRTAFI